MKDRVAKLFVGLAAPCDPPGQERAVAELMQANLKGAQTLPFVGFVTPDLQWVAGFSGGKSASGLASVIDAVENSPLLQASPEVTKKLTALAEQAAAAAEKAQWPKVLAAAKQASALRGRSPIREQIDVALGQARAWAATEMTGILDVVRSGGDRSAARAALKKVSGAFVGEPEAREADAGMKAIDKYGVILAIAPDKQAAAREKAAKDFAGTRWTALFAAPAAAPEADK